MAYGRVSNDDYGKIFYLLHLNPKKLLISGFADGGNFTLKLFVFQGFLFLLSLVAFSLCIWIR